MNKLNMEEVFAENFSFDEDFDFSIFPEYELSPEFEVKMHVLFEQFKKDMAAKERKRRSARFRKRLVGIIIAAALIGSLSVFSVNIDALTRFVTEYHEGNRQLSVNPEAPATNNSYPADWTNYWAPLYMTNHYQFEVAEGNKVKHTLFRYNQNQIVFSQGDNTFDVNGDTDGLLVHGIVMNNVIDVKAVERSIGVNTTYVLTWSNGSTCFCLESKEGFSEMIKIAESLYLFEE